MPDLLRRFSLKLQQMVAFAQSTQTPISLTLDTFKIKRRCFVAIAKDGIKLRLQPSCGESFTFFENLVRRAYISNGIKLNCGDTVVDIGANIGSFAVLAATLVGPTGRVVAYEPVPKTFDRLKNNVALNGFHNVECKHAAVDAHDGTMCMIAASKSALSTAHLRRDQKADAAIIEVPTITLARACIESALSRIHLLKIDCEGSEYGIFETMSPDVALRIDQIAMEVHEVEGKSADLLAMLIENLGFTVTRRGWNWFAVRPTFG